MTKRLNATMRGFLLGLFAGLAMHTSAQVDDGIYVIPSFDAYLVILSRNDIVNAYYFGLDEEDSYWLAMQGSRVGETIELADQVNGELGASRLEQDGLGLKMSLIYCNKYPLDVENPCGDSVEEVAVFPVLKANGNLKAIYLTQYGADYAIFESDGTGVLLVFEYGEDLNDRTWIGAYTGIINEDLTFTNPETAVESVPDEDEDFTFQFSLQISDLVNPQATFANFSCVDNRVAPSERGCEFLQETYFSKLIRKF